MPPARLQQGSDRPASHLDTAGVGGSLAPGNRANADQCCVACDFPREGGGSAVSSRPMAAWLGLPDTARPPDWDHPVSDAAGSWCGVAWRGVVGPWADVVRSGAVVSPPDPTRHRGSRGTLGETSQTAARLKGLNGWGGKGYCSVPCPASLTPPCPVGTFPSIRLIPDAEILNSSLCDQGGRKIKGVRKEGGGRGARELITVSVTKAASAPHEERKVIKV